jgi:hypothetical protein
MAQWFKWLPWVALLVVVFLLFRSLRIVNGYSQAPITTNMKETPDIFKANSSLECLPGPGPNADYYTDDMGGLCGLQTYVHDLGHTYKIQDGIGGGLLDD